jgi:hypothetical protein
MAITLADLRTYCAEIAGPDMSGSTADREHMIWINNAIRRVFSALAWDRIEHQQKLYVEPEESGSAMNVTQGSRSLVLTAGTFLAKYVTERWELVIDGEGSQTFELASIDNDPTNTQATMRVGDEWILATATGKTYYFLKTIYELPDNAKRVQRVQVLGSGQELIQLQPHEFDLQKAHNPAQRGAYPRFYCFRKNNLEIWPHPGSTRLKLGITYVKGPPAPYTTATAGTQEIDWDEEWRDLLEAAIRIEAAVTQGENAPIPYAIAVTEWEQRLKTYQGLDNMRGEAFTGPIGLQGPLMDPFPRERSYSWVGPIVDA